MKIENNYLCFEQSEFKKDKKITARIFVGLAGFDNFKTPHDYLLQMFGFFDESETSEEKQQMAKYLKRGNYAENIVFKVYMRDGMSPIMFDKKAIEYDNFKHIKRFGGLIDIDMPFFSTLSEVKSKNIKEFENIEKWPPKKEIYQGLFYGYLQNYDKINMDWIFFDDKTEQEVMNDLPVTTNKHLKKITKTYDVDRVEMFSLMKQTEDFVDAFIKDPKIPIEKISPKILQKVIRKWRTKQNVQK